MKLDKIIQKLNKIERRLEEIDKKEHISEIINKLLGSFNVKRSNKYFKLKSEETELKIFMGFKDGKKYYSIFADGSYQETNFDFDNKLHKYSIRAGLFFNTEEEAKKELDKERALSSIRWFIKKNKLSFKPNFDDENESKYYIKYDNEMNVFYTASNCHYQSYSPIGYACTREHAQQVVSHCNDYLKIIFDK